MMARLLKVLSSLLALLVPGTGNAESYEKQRMDMVQEQIVARGVVDPRVLEAMRTVPRHEFVPEDRRGQAYEDRPVPIGSGQTISQPFIVALMTEQLEVSPGAKVLEIGTGSGYQAAILHELTPHVFTIEIVKSLHQTAKPKLLARGFTEDQVILGDGYKGLAGEAPFDRIIVTAAPPEIPPALVDQLAPGGRMVVPVGGEFEVQQLKIITKDAEGLVHERELIPVRFVPMKRGID